MCNIFDFVLCTGARASSNFPQCIILYVKSANARYSAWCCALNVFTLYKHCSGNHASVRHFAFFFSVSNRSYSFGGTVATVVTVFFIFPSVCTLFFPRLACAETRVFSRSFFFFFFLHVNSNLTWIYCLCTVHQCLCTVHVLKNIKNRSHDTIYTFKNYFATMFSVFSFQQK